MIDPSKDFYLYLIPLDYRNLVNLYIELILQVQNIKIYKDLWLSVNGV